jgi:hypothetical protein
MASPGGRLSLLAVVTIFVVVVGSMHLGLQYSRGNLWEREAPSQLEADLRVAIQERVDAARAERGLDFAQHDAGVRVQAQQTAEQLRETGYFGAATAVGAANGSVPNGKPLCRQVPAKYTVTHPDWNASGGVSEGAVRAVADGTVDLFGREDTDVLGVPNDHQHGLGVAVEGNVVYVVYRYCNLGY